MQPPILHPNNAKILNALLFLFQQCESTNKQDGTGDKSLVTTAVITRRVLL